MFLTVLIILVIFIVLVVIGLSVYFSIIILYPRVIPRGKTYTIEVEKGRLVESEYSSWEKKHVAIRSPHGYNLSGIYFPIPDSNKTIILSHGIAYSLYGTAKYLPLFRKLGFNVLINDLRYHGFSGGANCTYGYHEKQDLKAWVDWTFTKLPQDGIVGLMGESMGAATSIQHAAIDPRVSFVISDCSFADLESLFIHLIKQDYHLPPFPFIPLTNFFTRMLGGISFKNISPARDMGKITRPVLLIHSQDDRFVPLESIHELVEARKNGLSRLYIAPNGKHAETYWKNKAEYERVVREFLTEIGIESSEFYPKPLS